MRPLRRAAAAARREARGGVRACPLPRSALSAGAAPRDPRAALPLVLALDVVARDAPCGAGVSNATSGHSCCALHHVCAMRATGQHQVGLDVRG